eukprot:360772-Chlamydomonas_euryale.AAC.10
MSSNILMVHYLYDVSRPLGAMDVSDRPAGGRGERAERSGICGGTMRGLAARHQHPCMVGLHGAWSSAKERMRPTAQSC